MDREGRYLINDLAEAGWYIFNGCGKGDEGESGRRGRGKSVLDYVIGNEEVWERVI